MLNRIKKCALSFKAAFSGIFSAVNDEAHLRFHLTAAFYVIILGLIYGLSAAGWTVIILLISAVISAELLNTAIAAVCDETNPEYSPLIKIAKDAAAGAVLVLAIGAVVIAVILFGDTTRLYASAVFVISRPWLLILLSVSVIISVVFTALGPRGILRLCRKKKK
jgi:diacylglycerol kinase (ATP)